MPFVTAHLKIFHRMHHLVITESDLYFTFCSTLNVLSKARFTGSNFDPINIENFCVRDGICWCSHDPVFASNYFVTSSKNFNNSCFENFMPTSP